MTQTGAWVAVLEGVGVFVGIAVDVGVEVGELVNVTVDDGDSVSAGSARVDKSGVEEVVAEAGNSIEVVGVISFSSSIMAALVDKAFTVVIRLAIS